MTILLETERLRLRQLREEDETNLLALDSDPDVMRYIGPVVTDIAAHRTFLRERALPYYQTHPGYGFFAAEERRTGAFLGWFILRPGPDYRFANYVGFTADDVEIGYRLHKAYWGQGIATEGASALRDYAFQEQRALAVAAVTLITNLGSRRVMEKIGMRYVGENPIPGYEVPAVTYRLLRDDFAAQE